MFNDRILRGYCRNGDRVEHKISAIINGTDLVGFNLENKVKCYVAVILEFLCVWRKELGKQNGRKKIKGAYRSE